MDKRRDDALWTPIIRQAPAHRVAAPALACRPALVSGMGRASVLAAKWSVLTVAARFLLQLVAQVVLARLLGPENYGIFGIGLVVYTFSSFLTSFGFGWSLQQRAIATDEDIRFAFTWQVMVGTLTMLGLYFSAPTLAAYFHEPRALPVIEWLSLACLISAAASPAGNLLQRDLNFKALGLMQVASYAVGYIAVGIPMALLGYGAAALVAAWLTQVLVGSLGNFALRPHALRPLFWYPGASSTVSVGSTVFVTNIVNWLLNNLDRIFIGRLLNAQAVGLYTAGYNLATMPNALLLGALQPAFLSAGARLQGEPKRLAQAYLQILATVWVLIFPFFVFLSFISADVIQLLYGSKWSETGWILSVLFLSMPAYVTWGLSTPVLWNTHRKYHEFLLQLPILLVGGLGFYLFAGQGLRTAAVIAALLSLLRAVAICSSAVNALGLRATELAPEAGRGLLLGVICAGGAWAGQYATASVHLPIVSLAASGLITAGLVATLVLIRPQVLGEHAASMLIRFLPRLAGLLKKAMPDGPTPADVRSENT